MADVDDERDCVSDTDEEPLRESVRVERGVVDVLGLTVNVREPEPVTLEVVLRERVRVESGERDALPHTESEPDAERELLGDAVGERE